jgi:tetratricopeptide (TPR) repeat protein
VPEASIPSNGGFDPFEHHVVAGSEHLRHSRLADAQRAFIAALDANPGHPKALALLGLTYFRAGNYAQARPVYEELVALLPADPSHHLNLGLVYLKVGDADKAIGELERSRDLDPSQGRAVSYLGLAYARAGRFVEAYGAFLKAGQSDLAKEIEQHLSKEQRQGIEATLREQATMASSVSGRFVMPTQAPEPPPDRPVPSGSAPIARVALTKVAVEAIAEPVRPPPRAQTVRAEADAAIADASMAKLIKGKARPAAPSAAAAAAAEFDDASARFSEPEIQIERLEARAAEARAEMGVEPPVEKVPEADHGPDASPPAAAAAPAREPHEDLDDEPMFDERPSSKTEPTAPIEVRAAPRTLGRSRGNTLGDAVPHLQTPVTAISRAVAQAEPTAAGAGVAGKGTRVAAGARPPQPLSELATARLVRPEDGDHPFEISGTGVLVVRVDGRIYTRTEGVDVTGGTLAYEPASRRARGRDQSEPFSMDGRSMFVVTGNGHLIASPLGGQFTAVQLDDDIFYLREDLVFAFEPGLRWENGHVPGSQAQLLMVQFRGSGAVAFRTMHPLLAVKLAPDRVLYVDAHALAGWIGRVVPRGVQAAGNPGTSELFVECTGEGVVLVQEETAPPPRPAAGP